MMKIIVNLIIALFMSLVSSAQEGINKHKIDPHLVEMAKQDANIHSLPIEVVVELVNPSQINELAIHGFTPNTILGNKLTLHIPYNQLSKLSTLASVAQIKYGRLESPTTDSVLLHTQTLSVHKAWGPIDRAYTGKGIIIGIVDTGVDFKHGEFRYRNNKSKTRILYIWNQWDETGNPPDSFSFGTEYQQKVLQNEIDGITKGAVKDTDFDPTFRGGLGHGTHVAGIAAGINGMAPESEIIGVSVNWTTASIIDGVKYVINKAILQNKPCVVNLSLGSAFDIHDGTGWKAEMYEQLANIRKEGTIICAAAGNSGTSYSHYLAEAEQTERVSWVFGDPIQWAVAVPDSALSSLQFSIKGYTGTIDLSNYKWADTKFYNQSSWFKATDLQVDTFKQTLYLPGGFEKGAEISAYLEEKSNNSNYTFIVISIDDLADVELRGENKKAEGLDLYQLKIKGSGGFHAWLMAVSTTFTGSFVRSVPKPSAFDLDSTSNYFAPDNETTVLSPALYKHTFSVGSYVNKYSYVDVEGNQQPPRWGRAASGSFSSFSSRGPTLDNRINPEISAPGQNVLAASPPYYEGFSPKVYNGLYSAKSGTSMASPVVAGAVALYLEKFPKADLEEVRAAFLQNTNIDDFTGPKTQLPNNKWGYGKLNTFKALTGIYFGLETALNSNTIGLFPNPGHDNIQLNGEWNKVQVYDIFGRLVIDAKPTETQSISVSHLSSGIYFFRVETPQGVQSIIFNKL